MEQQKTTYDALKEILPNECLIAGESNVTAIAAGPVEIVRAHGGSNFDIHSILEILAAASELLYNMYEIISKYKTEHGTLEHQLKALIDKSKDDRLTPEIKEQLRPFLLTTLEKSRDMAQDEVQTYPNDLP